jgi:hypothetical protein
MYAPLPTFIGFPALAVDALELPPPLPGPQYAEPLLAAWIGVELETYTQLPPKPGV